MVRFRILKRCVLVEYVQCFAAPMQPYVHPSVPKSPTSAPTPLGVSTRENLPPRPDYADLPRRPSDIWLNSANPGWMGE
jgi:hypothetical protein